MLRVFTFAALRPLAVAALCATPCAIWAQAPEVPATPADHAASAALQPVREDRIPATAWVLTPLPAGATVISADPGAAALAAGEELPAPASEPQRPLATPMGGAARTGLPPARPDATPVAEAPLPRGAAAAPNADLPQAAAHGRSLPGAALPPELVRELKRRGVEGSDVMVYVQAIDASSPLLAMNEERSVTLASTTKLLTSMAALDVLGSQFRWRTQAYALGRMNGDVLDGDLLVVGGGDPELDAAALMDWMAQWRKRGLRRINGHILVDRRAFRIEEDEHDATPLPTPLNPHHARPDALLVNEGRITLYIESDAQGAPAFSADLLPQGVIVKSELVNLPAGRGCSRIRQSPTLEVERQGDTVVLKVIGEWARDCERRRIEVLALPSGEHALRSLHAAWLRAGGELGGSVRDVPPQQRVPRGKPWMVRQSAPLSDVLLDVNKWSNNVKARQVFLSLAPKFPAQPATLGAARKVFRGWLDGQGLSEADESAIAVDNGSGLSREERGAARVMAELLRRAWSRPQSRPMLASLPLVGRDGTMASRLQGSDVEGHAFIKTGTLRGVRAIAGYVQARSGAVYAIVSVIQNAGASAQGALDRIIAWVHDEH